MTAMPHLAAIDWDHADRMQSADLGGGGTVWFLYDSAGNRVRKIRVNQAGTSTNERIYLGGYEVYRERVGTELRLERQTLHIADDSGRICLVETKTIDDADVVPLPANISRYQYGNHLGSVGMELDETGQLISYEEFHPYGTTAYRAANSAVDVSPSRYRYTGQERDEETGLGHHGVRYYASWLARWTAADPIGLGDGVNRFAYARGRPATLTDPTGTLSVAGIGDFAKAVVSGVGTAASKGATAVAHGVNNVRSERGSPTEQGLAAAQQRSSAQRDPAPPTEEQLAAESARDRRAYSASKAREDVASEEARAADLAEGAWWAKQAVGFLSPFAETLKPIFLERVVTPEEEEARQSGTYTVVVLLSLAFLRPRGGPSSSAEPTAPNSQVTTRPSRTAGAVETGISIGRSSAPYEPPTGTTQAPPPRTAGAPHGEGHTINAAEGGGEASSAIHLSDDALRHLSPEMRKSVRSWSERLSEHRQKLDAYRADPDAFDNKGFLRNAPSEEVRQRIIDTRVRHLEGEIRNFEKQISDALRGGSQ